MIRPRSRHRGLADPSIKPVATFTELIEALGKEASHSETAPLRFPEQPSGQTNRHQRIAFADDVNQSIVDTEQLWKSHRIEMLLGGIIGADVGDQKGKVEQLVELFGRPDEVWLCEYQDTPEKEGDPLHQGQGL